jgi:hypothetical protein
MKCFDHHKINKIKCNKIKCKYWIKSAQCQNCCLVGALKSKNLTLQDVGEIFGVTRMRICQIEKNAIQKLKDKILSNLK